MHWNHRVCKKTQKNEEYQSTIYGIHEVFYNEAGNI